MNLALEKQKIKLGIDKLNDESILLSIKRLLGLATDKHRVLHSKEDLITRALESEKAISEKKFSSIDELEREMRNW